MKLLKSKHKIELNNKVLPYYYQIRRKYYLFGIIPIFSYPAHTHIASYKRAEVICKNNNYELYTD